MATTDLKIFAKLMAIQSELKAPKSQFNKFGGYKYRKAEDILEAVKPITYKYGCALTCTDELLLIGDRYYIKATATLIDAESGATTCTTAYAREEEEKKGMDGSQVTGASSSYARKYALNGLLCIDDTADSDTTNVGDGKPAQEPRQEEPKPKPAQRTKTKAADLTKLEDYKYKAWVEGAALGKMAKSGIPVRDAFIATFFPTPEQLDAFDEAVLNYRLDYNIPATPKPAEQVQQ